MAADVRNAQLIKAVEERGYRARRDRFIQKGRVIQRNDTDRSVVLDVGIYDAVGNPVYFTSEFQPHTPPQINDDVIIDYGNVSPHSAHVGAGLIGGANAGNVVQGIDAPVDAEYVVLATHSRLTAEVQLGAGVIMYGLASARPAASKAGRIYFASDTRRLSRDNGTTWDNLSPDVPDYLDFTHTATPATPSAGKGRVYVKSDNKVYLKDPAGTETLIGPSAGGYTDPTTTAGDVPYRNASNVLDRLPVGASAKIIRSRGGTLVPTYEFMDESLWLPASTDAGIAEIKGHAGTLATSFTINGTFSAWFGKGIRMFGGASDDNSIYFGPLLLHRYFYLGYMPSIQIYYFNPRTTLSASSGNVYLQMELVGANAGISLALAPTATAYGTAKAAPAPKTVDFIEIVPGALETSFFAAAWSQLRIRRDATHASDTTAEDIVIVGVDLVFQRQ